MIPSIIVYSIKKDNIIFQNESQVYGGITNILELYKIASDGVVCSILFEDEIIYTEDININIKIENYKKDSKYKLKIYINDEFIKEESLVAENEISINLNEEGEKKFKIYVYKDEEEIGNIEKTVYYIRKYEKQFLDELSINGVSTHFGHQTYIDNINQSIDLIKALGVNCIRDDIRWEIINKSGYDSLDKWLQVLHSNDIKIIGILGFPDKNSLGADYKISDENELKKYEEYVKNVFKRYSYIYKYEIWNEPNSNWKSDNDMYWYTRMVTSTNEIIGNDKTKIIIGGLMTPEKDTSSSITAQTFFQKIFNNKADIYSQCLSYHQYDSSYTRKYMKKMYQNIQKTINNYGGFIKTGITENGVKTEIGSKTQSQRADEIIKQMITEKNISSIYIYYCLRDIKSESSALNYGLLNNDYTPKPAYYAMKNYYENTNGAEYIGTVNIADGLESHVYDKDGKPVIITWAEDNTKNIQIDYQNFKAKDLYGKDIQADENGKLIITTSPVYLYDVDYSYFYKAISNVAKSKYDEFKEKFATEISQVSGLLEKINQRQNYSSSVATSQKLMQSTAITAMKNHYELGNIILKAYEQSQLNAEPVKVSSMLDMLNDIGNSYEDLVTVSVNNTINSVMQTLDEAEANFDSSEINSTKQKIDETEKLINNNTDVEIIYPTKILEFSKDCYEKADYINSLEEQNDIKAGLIISNNLHAQLLANWTNTFASIQINNNIKDYIAQNPITIEYSETNITNKSVKATIKINAEIQITNNSNSKEYVFEQNGSFTFEYTIKGQAKQITAKVTNIDKTSPTVNGVVDGKLYTSKVIPTITEENLDVVKLILNGEEIKSFKSGNMLTDEGFYTLTATDKAGNQTQISFQIMENSNQNYIIKDNTIMNISEQTTKSAFIQKIKLGLSYKITRNNKEIANTDNISTGDVLTTSAGDKYILVVTGDMNKDGKLNLKDLVKMRKYLLDGNNLDENEILAADCNFDGKINLKDLVKIRLMILIQEN